MLNLNGAYTTDDVANLLASKDDSQDRQLRVTTSGIAFLSDAVGNTNIEGLAFRFETWNAGNSYTGQAAAEDPRFVARIEAALRKNWPKPTNTFLDLF